MSATNSPEDKRQHPRVPVELKVEYKKLNTFFSDFTKNISKGGTFIKTSKPLPVGSELIFKLAVPGRLEPFVLRGQVAWIELTGIPASEERRDPGMGIRFLYDSDDARRSFEGVVEGLLRETLGDHVATQLLARERKAVAP